MANDVPSNRAIDALFAVAHSARVRGLAAGAVDPASGPVLAVFGADDLPRLRATLRIRETDEHFHCMCRGDLAIELRSRVFAVGTLSFHRGQSLRLDTWNSDAWLEDGPALLRLLAERGTGEPLRCVPWIGGEARTVCSLPLLGPSMGTPRIVASEGQVLVAADKRILAVDPRSGRSYALATADGTVRAIAACASWIALLVGSESDDANWEVPGVQRRGGNAERIGRFSRAPYHRHALVIAQDRACATAGDKVIAARRRQ